MGTPYFISPQVLEGNYDHKCDIWAIGVLTYILLCGYPPFMGESEVKVFNKIKTLDYSFPEEDWD